MNTKIENQAELNAMEGYGYAPDEIAEATLVYLAPTLRSTKERFDALEQVIKESKVAALEAWGEEMSDQLETLQGLTVMLSECKDRAYTEAKTMAEAGHHGAIAGGYYTIASRLQISQANADEVKAYLMDHADVFGHCLMVDWKALEKMLKGSLADDNTVAIVDCPVTFIEDIQPKINWSKLPEE